MSQKDINTSTTSAASSMASEAIASEAMLRAVAARVTAFGLTVPALAFLEMHRPLRGLAQAGALVLEPTLRFLIGGARASSLLDILDHPESIDRLMDLIEQRSGSCSTGTEQSGSEQSGSATTQSGSASTASDTKSTSPLLHETQPKDGAHDGRI